MDTRTAAERLGVEYDWLKKRASRREIPHTRLGRYVFFSEAQLLAIIDANSVDPMTKPRSANRIKL